MKQRCVQCGRVFNLSDSEIDFYKSKGLNLPKRCKTCRDRNKGIHHEYKTYSLRSSSKGSSLSAAIFLFTLVINIVCISAYEFLTVPVFLLDVFSAVAIVLLTAFCGKVEIQEFDTSPYRHTFYDTKSMAEHYAKHGKEVDCSNMEEYLARANSLIENDRVLSKIQEDGDTLYFNKRTNEFVVVAKAGYIRTYYIASEAYYNRQ